MMNLMENSNLDYSLRLHSNAYVSDLKYVLYVQSQHSFFAFHCIVNSGDFLSLSKKPRK